MKAVMYARVSSKEQEREGYSIPAQRKLLVEYAHRLQLTIVKTFEEAETAKRAGRHQFQEMLTFLKKHPDVKHVVVEKTDRLYRNFFDYVKLDFDAMGISIHLVKEGTVISSASRSGDKLYHGIKVVMAKHYLDNLSEEVRKGQEEKLSQGGWTGPAPLGYLNKLDDHTVIPCPTMAPLVLKAFELAATGQYTSPRLKKALFHMGLKSKRAGNELQKSAMHALLRNPFYYGEMIRNKKRYPGRHQPIVTKSLFDRAQEAMGFAKKARPSKKNFAFTGLMTCVECGCGITAEEHPKKSGKTYVYYHCTGGKGPCGNVKYLPEKKVESAFVAALEAIQLTPEIVEYTRQALADSFRDEKAFHDRAVGDLVCRNKKLQDFINKCYEDKLEGTIDIDSWRSKTADWKAEQREVATHLQALHNANTAYLDDGVRLMELASRAASLFGAMTEDEKRQMVATVLLNPKQRGATIEYDYQLPFKMFVNVVDLKEWRDGRDLNPRPPA